MNPKSAAAFERMLREAAASIDRAGEAGELGPAEPRRGEKPPAAAETSAVPTGAPAAPVWPPDGGEKARVPQTGDSTNPYDLLKESSRVQERAAARLLAARRKDNPRQS